MRILLVEDHPQQARYTEKALKEAGHTVELACDGQQGLQSAMAGSYDVIVLDRMLPQLDGLSVLRTLRGEGIGVPVLLLSALSEVDERVEGLRAGADDYLPKPYNTGELLARIEALLRRGASTQQEQVQFRVQDLELDRLARVVRRAGRKIELQPREFQLLEYLMRHAGHVVTRTMLLEGVWSYHFDPGTNVIDVHISKLRGKIDLPDMPPLLHTVRGAGYRLGSPA